MISHEPLPPFGHAMRAEWALDPAVTYLNHGTVGAPPRRVLAVQQSIRDEIERQPSRFLLRELSRVGVGVVPGTSPRMRVAAAEVAAFLGARGEDLVFVDNATTGANAVLRSFDLAPDDEIVVSDHGYGAVTTTARYVARTRGARVVVVELPDAPADDEAIVAAFAGAIGPRTRLVIADHVAAESARILPVAQLAARCRAGGVPLLVDGAHAPGALALDVPAIGADWYTGNLHKWAMSPRSCAFLWVAPARQSTIHPTVISWGLDKGFEDEFDWVGTRDPSAWLAAPAGIEFMRHLGLDAMRSYNHALAWSGARRLCERWDTPFELRETQVGCMATVPLPERYGSGSEDAIRVRDALLFGDSIEAPVHAWHGRLWLRLSAQVYNDASDVERLADAVLARG